MPLPLDPDKIARMQAVLARQTDTASEAAVRESATEGASHDPVPATPAPAGRESLRLSDTLTHDGLTLTIAEWSVRLGIHASTIHARLRRGFPVAQVLHVGKLPRKRRSTRADAESP
jgi:hypothetical protein